MRFSTNYLRRKRQTLLDLSNSKTRVETLGACPRAVHDSMASVNAHAVVKGVFAFSRLLVAGVRQPAVAL